MPHKHPGFSLGALSLFSPRVAWPLFFARTPPHTSKLHTPHTISQISRYLFALQNIAENKKQLRWTFACLPVAPVYRNSQ
jgi:hypothetical protein